PTAGTASATQRTCAGDPFTLLLTGSTVGGNLTYQWQSSPQGAGTWTNLTGATTISYTVTNQTADTDYRCIVTCTTSNSNDTSTVVSVAHIAPIGNFYEDFETTVTGGYSNPTVPDCWSYFVNTGYGYGYTSTGGQTGNGTKQVRFSANLSSTGMRPMSPRSTTFPSSPTAASRPRAISPRRLPPGPSASWWARCWPAPTRRPVRFSSGRAAPTRPIAAW